MFIKSRESSAELSLQMSPDIHVTRFENHLQRMLMSNKYQVCILFLLVVEEENSQKRGKLRRKVYVSRDKRSKISSTLGMSVFKKIMMQTTRETTECDANKKEI